MTTMATVASTLFVLGAGLLLLGVILEALRGGGDE